VVVQGFLEAALRAHSRQGLRSDELPDNDGPLVSCSRISGRPDCSLARTYRVVPNLTRSAEAPRHHLTLASRTQLRPLRLNGHVALQTTLWPRYCVGMVPYPQLAPTLGHCGPPKVPRATCEQDSVARASLPPRVCGRASRGANLPCPSDAAGHGTAESVVTIERESLAKAVFRAPPGEITRTLT
jgi:hypothetical protein